MNPVYPLTWIVFVFSPLALVATAAATTNVVQVFVNPGNGSVGINSTDKVARELLSGYCSLQAFLY
ncbi:hypothetical protein [Methanoregula sp.]|uniref:hypothetical protein n=2 Tax=Methanoregula sp. TaxID=2052170 RepID=UPI003BAF4C0D